MIALAAALAILPPQAGGPLIPVTAPSFDDAVRDAVATMPSCARVPVTDECAADRYDRFRITPAAAGADAKTRAVAFDGTECNLVGSRLCTSNGIPLLRSQR